jgi:endo-1,4-beta-xylanase
MLPFMRGTMKAEGLSRRKFLSKASAVGAGAYALLRKSSSALLREHVPAQDPSTTPLKTLAASKGFLFGSSATQPELATDPQYEQVFASQCGLLVPELELKWFALRPTPDTFDFGPADWLYNYAQQRQMKFRGHTLVWHAALPHWFGSYANSQNAKQLLLTHINTVVTHYAGKMHSWDVINEAMFPSDGRSDGLRNSPWMQFLGPDYIEMAFRAAAAADPNAILSWNEGNIENGSASIEEKRRLFLLQLKELRRRNVPIHAIGVQSHLVGTDPGFAGPQFANFLDEVSALGLKILVTEMDITDYDPDTGIAKRNQMIGSRYEQYLNVVLKRKSVIAVLTWGMSDRYTWTHRGFKWPRRDGVAMVPLPYDENMSPKPAWYGMARAFENAPQR